MHFVSTRHAAPPATLSAAIAAGLAPDGGLYVPEQRPQPQPWQGQGSLARDAQAVLAPYFAGDELAPQLAALCDQAFNVPAPLRALSTPGDHVLELFHGPTAAFKDFGARFLAASLAMRARKSRLVKA